VQREVSLNLEQEERASALEPKLIGWRLHIHQHPELSNREVRTSRVIARHLLELGIPHQTQVAYTGVVGLLDTGRPGPVVALRADMDALPVTEEVDLPFASTERTPSSSPASSTQKRGEWFGAAARGALAGQPRCGFPADRNRT
jgi:hypothetical protein